VKAARHSNGGKVSCPTTKSEVLAIRRGYGQMLSPYVDIWSLPGVGSSVSRYHTAGTQKTSSRSQPPYFGGDLRNNSVDVRAHAIDVIVVGLGEDGMLRSVLVAASGERRAGRSSPPSSPANHLRTEMRRWLPFTLTTFSRCPTSFVAGYRYLVKRQKATDKGSGGSTPADRDLELPAAVAGLRETIVSS
jgi:hypothetical protein